MAHPGGVLLILLDIAPGCHPDDHEDDQGQGETRGDLASDSPLHSLSPSFTTILGSDNRRPRSSTTSRSSLTPFTYSAAIADKVGGGGDNAATGSERTPVTTSASSPISKSPPFTTRMRCRSVTP